MYHYFARAKRDLRPPFMAIAALAVSLSGCVTEERSTQISRRDLAVASAPAQDRQCTVQELRAALAARQNGYDYVLHCS